MQEHKLDPNSGSYPSCDDEYFCEYVCLYDVWYLVDANSSSGYYCPADPGWGPGPHGHVICMNPAPIESMTPEFSEGEHFVEYEYRDGKFQVSKASCPVGYHAPMDPIEFAKKHGKLRIYPAKLNQPPQSPDNIG